MVARRTKVLLGFLLLIGGGYLVGHFTNSTVAVPPDFKEARAEGTLISDEITRLSNTVSQELQRVSELEREGRIVEAMNVTTDLLVKTGEMREKAQGLSLQLQKMTGALSDIRSEEARGYALESITDHLAMISRLISYSDYLHDLLIILQDRFTGTPSRGGSVGEIIAQVNGEVAAINNFNRQAITAMESFDTLIGEKK